MDVIETERLVLRPYEPADAPRVLDIHRRVEVVRWLSNPPFVLMETEDDAHTRMAEWRARDAPSPYALRLAIVPRSTGRLAGGVGVTRLPDDPVGRHEVGWHLHPDSTGHGYVTEAAVALLDTVFARGLDEVWCTMYPDNVASAAVARRLGLTYLGLLPDRWYGDESPIFHISRDQWLAR